MRVRWCARCGIHPCRPGTRKLPLPLFCWSCTSAEDQLPHDLEHFGSRGVVHAEMEARRRRIQAGQVVQSRAERLLATLSGIERWVWQMVVNGLSERRIAERLGLSRQEAFGWYLRPLRARAGLPARPRRYRGRAA